MPIAGAGLVVAFAHSLENNHLPSGSKFCKHVQANLGATPPHDHVKEEASFKMENKTWTPED